MIDRHYINNIEVEVLNAEELDIELNFDRSRDVDATSTIDLEFGVGSQVHPSDAATLFNGHINGGLGSGVGVFEGLPYKREITKGSTTYVVYDGYIDPRTAVYDCDKIRCTAVVKGSVDWISAVADSISYEGMLDDGEFDSSDFVSVPYVLSSIPNAKEALLTTISMFLLFETVISSAQTLIEYIGGVASLGWADVIKVILRSLYIASLFLIVIQLLRQVFNYIIQPIKYHTGMTVKRLCEIGAAHYGFNFNSTILNDPRLEGLVIIPKKYNHEIEDNNDSVPGLIGKSQTLGFKTSNNPKRKGFYQGTFGDLLRELQKMFAAKIVISNGTLRLEREDFNNSAANWQLPPIDKTEFTINWEDLKSNYEIEFLKDINDKNTLQDFKGSYTQITQKPIRKTNQDMILFESLESVNIGFSRCSKKQKISNVESVFESLDGAITRIANVIIAVQNIYVSIVQGIINTLDAILLFFGFNLQSQVDSFLNTFNGAGLSNVLGAPLQVDINNIDFLKWTYKQSVIGDRRGMLLMENDFIDVPKIGIFNITDNPQLNTLKIGNELFINTEWLYNNFHFIRNFVPSTVRPNANQYKIYEKEDIPFCFDAYEKVMNSNFIKDDEDRTGEIITATWNVRKEKLSNIRYKINELYTNNVELTIKTPDGK